MKNKVIDYLTAIGLTPADFAPFTTLQDEFRFLRRAYLQKCLATHPDKGGDVEAFRECNTAFETLKELLEKDKIESFASIHADTEYTPASSSSVGANDDEEETPSWEYYQQAAEEDMAPYHMELAKSGRGKCFAKKPGRTCGEVDQVVNIPKDTVRIGSVDNTSGGYGRWCHLQCWRVLSRVWLGLPNPDKELNPQAFVEGLKKMDQVALSGFSSLPEQDQLSVVEHVRNIEHWAALRKKKTGTTKKDKKKKASTDGDIKPEAVPSVSQLTPEPSSAIISTSTLVLEKAQKKKFAVPIPGQDGYVKDALLGKTIVLTGIFPEVGGGAGLSLGKDKAKALCQQFGARVTSSISGKTSLLLVGKEPGMSKVSKAYDRHIPLVDLNELVTTVLKGIKAIEDVDEPVIGQFSSGYNDTGLALKASEEDLNSFRKPSPKRKVIAAGPSLAATATSSKKKKAKTAKQSVPPAPTHNDENINDENANPENAAYHSLLQEYMNLTVKALKVLLKERGLKVGGNKSVLVKRLVESDTNGDGGVNA